MSGFDDLLVKVPILIRIPLAFISFIFMPISMVFILLNGILEFILKIIISDFEGFKEWDSNK